MPRKSASKTPANPYFKIKIIDSQTKRGVPLIRLIATGPHTEYYTDSNGLIAFYEPGLMDRPVQFLVDGHGYVMPKNDKGQRAVELTPTSGGEAVIEIHRMQAAERLYRITGQGIYQDTVLLGEKAPIEKPVLNAGVTGSDSTQTAIYKGKVLWIWGDTKSPRSHHYWNFKVTGALSDLPENGGLDPEVGVDLHYYEKGDFTKQMAPLPGGYLYWLSSLHTAIDKSGQERLLAYYGKIAPASMIQDDIPVPAKSEDDDTSHRAMGHGKFKAVGWGRAIFNDETEAFESLEEHPIDPKTIGRFGGSPTRHTEEGTDYYYFTAGIPCRRVRYDFDALGDMANVETFTCLKEGVIFAEKPEDVERDVKGRPVYAWKKNTGAIDPAQAEKMVKAGFLKDNERLCRFTDASTGQQIWARGGFYYNPYRKRWIGILLEVGGKTALGEVWYVEGDTALGPYVFAAKIVTHSNYSFYNIYQHPYFAKKGGRDIFFEGTYTYTFTQPLNTHPTPRYDYNQIMYKLDLEDPRIYLPVPIYQYDDPTHQIAAVESVVTRYRHSNAIPEGITKRQRVFFAPDRPRKDCVPIYEGEARNTGATILTRTDYDVYDNRRLPVAFYGIPPETGESQPMTTGLYEYIHTKTGERLYAIKNPADVSEYTRSADPICLVWKSPIDFDPFAV